MTIERLTTDATARLRELRLRALQDSPDAFGSTYEETATRPESSWVQQLRDLPTFVAVVDGHDVGMVRGGSAGHDTAELISMWVAPEARRMGVGIALIDEVIAWAKSAGFTRIQLDVAEVNTPANALYERAGFLPSGNRSTLPPPRQHITEMERVRPLAR